MSMAMPTRITSNMHNTTPNMTLKFARRLSFICKACDRRFVASLENLSLELAATAERVPTSTDASTASADATGETMWAVP
eukprot:CAMPEP_0115708480 /NCGR_PEP_ID=MMETSP0272-20121206/71936_1 /TAXON_ID=71861 /ORGANISM="Scrippsiella trochoidea, Strain CCMP3099" /LENGTH=79 /DNA_ID=CAMNT_0003149977 /DNA_START=49 /DNA_END=284 /DNA_ORIENTATION=-